MIFTILIIFLNIKNSFETTLSPNKTNFRIFFIILTHLQAIINLKPKSPFDEHFNKLGIVTRTNFDFVYLSRIRQSQIDIDWVGEINFIQKFNIGSNLSLVYTVGHIIIHPEYHTILFWLYFYQRFKITKVGFERNGRLRLLCLNFSE